MISYVRRRWWLWLVLSLAVLIIDQASKLAMLLTLHPGEGWIITPFFSLVLAFNTGAAFSFLRDAAGWQRYLFSGIAIVAALRQSADEIKFIRSPQEGDMGIEMLLLLAKEEAEEMPQHA